MSKYKEIYIFVLFAFVSEFIGAQSTCSDKLKLAKQLFEAGQIEQIPELLDSCIAHGFGKSEEKEAYRLLIQTYLFDYNTDKAKEVTFRFLKKFPEYHLLPTDPIEIKEIFDFYKVRPSWGFGLYGGITQSHVTSLQNYSVLNLNTLTSKYSQKIGYDAGLFIDKYIGSHFALSLGLNMKTINYQNQEISADGSTNISIKENALWFSSPFSISYNFGKGKLSPYIFMGAELEYLNKAKGDFLYSTNQNNIEDQLQSANVDITAYRNLFNYSALGGLGLRYKIPKGYIKFRIGYNYMLTDYINKHKRYDNRNTMLNFGHIDDDLSLNHFTVAFTYTYLLYKITTKTNHATN